MSDDEGRPELRPARPDAEGSAGRPSYMPRLPWKWIILGAAAVIVLFGSYFVRRERRADALREQMLTLHEQRLGEVAQRYLQFRGRLESLVIEAAEAGEPERWADPRLNIGGLRSGEGLYLRIQADQATNAESIRSAARAMTPDSIQRCLGLAPMSVRGLYEKGDFLTPEWVDALRGEQDMMRLRVLDDQLGRHVQVDVPVVLSMLQADWFMLVLQQGDNRRDHPVDVYLWDLRSQRQLLRARIQGRGLLVPVRMRFEGVQAPAAEGRPQVRSGGAQDCSIASQIRALTGAEPIDFESGDAIVERAEQAAATASDAPPSDAPSDAPSTNTPSTNAPPSDAPSTNARTNVPAPAPRAN